MNKQNKKFDDLVDLMLSQAKEFLKEMGEFFPYGSVLLANKELSTIGIYNDDDNRFNTNKAIEIFTNHIKEGINKGEILVGAIGIDGFIKENNKNVVMIKVTDDGIKWHSRNYSYTIVNNIVQIEINDFINN